MTKDKLATIIESAMLDFDAKYERGSPVDPDTYYHDQALKIVDAIWDEIREFEED